MSKKSTAKSVANNETNSQENAAMSTEAKKNTTYTSIVIDTLREMGENRLNRDDDGTPKTVPYKGDVYRELSSQYLKYCLKRDTNLFLDVDSLKDIWNLCVTRNKNRGTDGFDFLEGNKAVDLTVKQLETLCSAKKIDDVVDESKSDQCCVLLSVDELCHLVDKKLQYVKKDKKEVLSIDKSLESCPYPPPMLALFVGRMFAGTDHFNTQAAMIVPDAISINPVKVYQDSFTRASSSRGLHGATAWGSQGKVSACIMHETYMLDISSVRRYIDKWSKSKDPVYVKAVEDSLLDTVTALIESAYAMPSMKNSTYRACMASYTVITLSNAQLGSNNGEHSRSIEDADNMLETFKKRMLDSIDTQIQRQKNQSLRRGLGENCITVKQYEIDGDGVMTRREKYCEAPCDCKILTDEDVKSDIVELLEKTL